MFYHFQCRLTNTHGVCASYSIGLVAGTMEDTRVTKATVETSLKEPPA